MEEKKKGSPKTTHSLTHEGKDNENFRGKQKVFMCLLERPKTRWQVAKETGIEINSICYLVGMLINENKCKVHHIGICPIKGSTGVEFITTDAELFPKEKQLSLFDILWKGGKK